MRSTSWSVTASGAAKRTSREEAKRTSREVGMRRSRCLIFGIIKMVAGAAVLMVEGEEIQFKGSLLRVRIYAIIGKDAYKMP